MFVSHANRARWWVGPLAAGLAGALLLTAAQAHEDKPASPQPDRGSAAAPMKPGEKGPMMGGHAPAGSETVGLTMPQMDSHRGRKLFASKGCVACHAVNGVGGHDATALDAHTMQPAMNPFEFAAKMWRMAPAMIAAQEEALGHQITFTGDELADIIAFVHDDAEQHEFSEADIPAEIRPMMHHNHGEPKGGAKAHGEELGHHHDD